MAAISIMDAFKTMAERIKEYVDNKSVEGGVGISSVELTTSSTENGGENIVTVTLSDGTSSTFSVYNGTQGETGADGKSAYEIAVDNGYEGTESGWLSSLKGDTGDTYTLTDEDKNEIAEIVYTMMSSTETE